LSGLFAFLVGRTQWRQLPEKTMQPGYFGDAGGPTNWQSQAASLKGAMVKEDVMLGLSIASAGKQELPAVTISIARLVDLVNVLESQSTALVDRLSPVSRPFGVEKGEGCNAAQESPQCSLDDELITLRMRIESVIGRIDSARRRLCI
jgi:hypothetical protein